MSDLMKCRTLSVSIDRPPEEVYAFASNPGNLPRWVTSFCQSVRRSGDDWFMETPAGSIGIRFAAANEFGILDHTVILPEGESILNPMRVVGNGRGSEVLFTLFQLAGMSDAKFEEDAAMIEADLRMLKTVLES